MPITITPDMLRRIGGPRAKSAITVPLAVAITARAPEAGVLSPLRMAHFLGQLAHESAGFGTMEEYASGQAYEGRKDLGNIRSGDGKRYKGRGPIQITGRANYCRYGAMLGLPLDDQPSLAAQPEPGARIALAYWSINNLNALADADNVRAITKRINGGYNGLADRIARVTLAKHVLAGKSNDEIAGALKNEAAASQAKADSAVRKAGISGVAPVVAAPALPIWVAVALGVGLLALAGILIWRSRQQAAVAQSLEIVAKEVGNG